MLKPISFANAVATVSVIFTIVLWWLGKASPELFKLIYNAQFLGADLASQYPRERDLSSVLTMVVVVGIMGWIMGYLWARLYNFFAK